MLPIPQVRAVCLELSRRKANPFSKHILEWLSTGSPDASSRTVRTIVISYVSEELVWLLSLSLFLFLFFSKRERNLDVLPVPFRILTEKRATLALSVHCMHGLSRISIRALLATATLKQSSRRRGGMSVQKRRSIKYLLWCVHSTLVRVKSCSSCLFLHSFIWNFLRYVARNFLIRAILIWIESRSNCPSRIFLLFSISIFNLLWYFIIN